MLIWKECATFRIVLQMLARKLTSCLGQFCTSISVEIVAGIQKLSASAIRAQCDRRFFVLEHQYGRRDVILKTLFNL